MRILRRGGRRREFSAACGSMLALKSRLIALRRREERSAQVCPAIQRGGRSQAGRGLLFIGQKSRIKDWQALRQKGWGGLADERSLVWAYPVSFVFAALFVADPKKGVQNSSR